MCYNATDMNEVPQTIYGVHTLADFFGCDPDILDDESKLTQILTDAAIKAGAKILDTTSHKFSPQGVTVLLLLAESHISIHTWPEAQYAAVDAFTCGQTTNPTLALDYIEQAVCATTNNRRVMSRGEREYM